jgi:hypothetical protein
VNDIDDALRELLQRKAQDVAPHREVPRALVSRARRRIGLNVLSVGVAVAVVVAGGFLGVRALTGPAPRQPAGKTTAPPPSTPSNAVIAACVSTQLRAVAGQLQGAAGSREGAINLTNTSGEACTLEGRPTITLLDHNRTPITSGITFSPSQAGWLVDRLPKPKGWPVVTIAPGGSAHLRISWSNWCLDPGAVPLWRMQIPGGGATEVTGFDASSVPQCPGQPGQQLQPSSIEIGPFEPGAQPDAGR